MYDYWTFWKKPGEEVWHAGGITGREDVALSILPYASVRGLEILIEKRERGESLSISGRSVERALYKPDPELAARYRDYYMEGRP